MELNGTDTSEVHSWRVLDEGCPSWLTFLRPNGTMRAGTQASSRIHLPLHVSAAGLRDRYDARYAVRVLVSARAEQLVSLTLRLLVRAEPVAARCTLEAPPSAVVGRTARARFTARDLEGLPLDSPSDGFAASLVPTTALERVGGTTVSRRLADDASAAAAAAVTIEYLSSGNYSLGLTPWRAADELLLNVTLDGAPFASTARLSAVCAVGEAPDASGACACDEGYGRDGGCVACPKGTRKDGVGNTLCLPCAALETTRFEATTSESGCVCVPGAFTPRASDGGDGRRCVACPRGANCSELNTSVASLRMRRGYWRDESMERPLRCEPAAVCAGGAGVGNMLCVEGSHGVKCNLCESPTAYLDAEMGGCIECEKRRSPWLLPLLLVLFSLLLLLVAACTLRRPEDAVIQASPLMERRDGFSSSVKASPFSDAQNDSEGATPIRGAIILAATRSAAIEAPRRGLAVGAAALSRGTRAALECCQRGMQQCWSSAWFRWALRVLSVKARILGASIRSWYARCTGRRPWRPTPPCPLRNSQPLSLSRPLALSQALVPSIYLVSFPPTVHRLIDGLVFLVNFDLLSAVPANCVGLGSYPAKLGFWMLLPLVLCGLVLSASFVLEARAGLLLTPPPPPSTRSGRVEGGAGGHDGHPTDGHTRPPPILIPPPLSLLAPSRAHRPLSSVLAAAGRRALPAMLLISFLSLPVVSSVAFAAFECEQFGERLYLRADYSILCQSPRWAEEASPFGVAAVLFYPVGVPLAYLALLVAAFHSEPGTATPLRDAMGFLIHAYHPSATAWEVRLETGDRTRDRSRPAAS